MTIERTSEGLEARLRPRGFGRFLSAGFLGFWLCGWAAGEGIVPWLLIRGAAALLSGRPPGPGHAPLDTGPALAAGLFMIFWLSFWTLGGVLAVRELLRLLWSEDRVVAGDASLDIHRRLGPFFHTIRIPRVDLIGIESLRSRGRLVAETESGLEELTRLGTAAERAELEAALRAEFGLAGGREGARQGPQRQVTLPPGWTEVLDQEGASVLVKDAGVRRVRAGVAWVAALVVSAVAVVALRGLPGHPEWAPLASMVTAAAVLLGYGAWRLTMTRREWRLESGRLTLRRRGRRGAQDLFEATALELADSADSDGDRCYILNAVGEPSGDAPSAAADPRPRRPIVRVMHDFFTPRRLGAWIAQRTGLRLEEREPLPNITWADTISRLESSGRLGRWLAARLPKP